MQWVNTPTLTVKGTSHSCSSHGDLTCEKGALFPEGPRPEGVWLSILPLPLGQSRVLVKMQAWRAVSTPERRPHLCWIPGAFPVIAFSSSPAGNKGILLRSGKWSFDNSSE